MKKSILKKLLGVAMVSVMAIAMIGCGSKADGANSEKDKLDIIQEKGNLVVGLSADYAPYEFHAMIDGKDTVVGFDVDLAKEIAKDLGVKLEIKEMEFDSLVTALPADKIDMVISGMNPDEERKKVIDFSDIYYTSHHGVIVRNEDKDKYKTIEDLQGKKVGAQLGSTQAQIAQEKIKEVDLKQLSNVNNLILELKTGKVDALIVEVPVAEMAIKANSELVLADVKFEEESGGNAVGIKKGSPKLIESVNKTIKRLTDSGELDKLIIDANNLAAEQAENN
ncbi:ABC transporter substrate-binding protein [Clostridium chauvoei]|uniref:ABC transporter substrate-binding protein n=2 Tax=Clostridium chauvoei TaxID=46867 RepID=A0ABD4RKF5_9CLOT|nr:ABC transporter substrate-binding protein [Clostridium chauvoei]ATD54146.1 amino acid ABC transporter [Clostridium chauvoei]ATD58174.1 amino acid ABC transporter [Clostridium chauvoei]MBX7281365.1 ABC transporter substrate-binding protein [Clostridium chauvoei]MBX7283847.1 ABC transporter substrate-binding protein [Clostridium chauvoei]MBX7286454.1 ABC transporter substrate-binding protein [Clostridium chauvoei]